MTSRSTGMSSRAGTMCGVSFSSIQLVAAGQPGLANTENVTKGQ